MSCSTPVFNLDAEERLTTAMDRADENLKPYVMARWQSVSESCNSRPSQELRLISLDEDLDRLNAPALLKCFGDAWLTSFLLYLLKNRIFKIGLDLTCKGIIDKREVRRGLTHLEAAKLC